MNAAGSQPNNGRVEELSDSDIDNTPFQAGTYLPPWLLGHNEALKDELSTTTSMAQRKTELECLPYLVLNDTQDLPLNSHGLPHLQRRSHSGFLRKQFEQLPAPYVVADAARPWYFYWVLQGLTALGEDVSEFKSRLLTTIRPLQNLTGGFAGGHGQQSHAAPTYACVMALAMVDGLDAIDRKTLWHFIGRLKQADGGFLIAEMAEEDIRGAYCALSMITLLNLPVELPLDSPARKGGRTTFHDGLGEWISRCQTYEGGISGGPTHEAHGAYAFCALACLAMMDSPSRSIARYLDVSALARWLVDIQASPEGGSAGRTNKLVDACYSHWAGGCWALIEVALPTVESPIWNREAMVRYLLTCSQQPGKGGFRDKPSTRPDAYHTCYSLAGLSAAQHHYSLAESTDTTRSTTCFDWTSRPMSKEEQAQLLLDDDELVRPVHPVFTIPFSAVDDARKKYAAGGL